MLNLKFGTIHNTLQSNFMVSQVHKPVPTEQKFIEKEFVTVKAQETLAVNKPITIDVHQEHLWGQGAFIVRNSEKPEQELIINLMFSVRSYMDHANPDPKAEPIVDKDHYTMFVLLGAQNRTTGAVYEVQEVRTGMIKVTPTPTLVMNFTLAGHNLEKSSVHVFVE